jgi:hypothetical protein
MKKYCFTCGKRLRLIMYHRDDSKYQLKSAMGKTAECRICTYKRAKSQGGLMSRIEGKFEFVPMTKIEILKYVVSKL